MPTKKSETEAAPVSPIAFRPCSNGEFCPREETERDRRAEELFLRLVEQKHKRTGMTRRAFAQSSCGFATALAVINQVYGCGSEEGPRAGGTAGKAGSPSSGSGASAGIPGAGASGGSSSSAGNGGVAGTGPGPADAGYDVNDGMMEDPEQACDQLMGDEFIFDVQVHPPSPLAPWTERNLPMDAETLVRTIFVDSDTKVCCLSGVPGARGLGIPNVQANQQLQELIDQFAGPRLMFHVNVDPTRGASELDYMQQLSESYPIGAWKVYPHVGPWRLDQDVGAAMIEKARELGIRRIAAHRGIGPGVDYQAASSPVDLVLAAKAYPDVQFLTYHSGWDSQADEDHPFEPGNPDPIGVDRLIKALVDNEIGHDGNVYAELGSTWRNLMTSPTEAAHVLGKLLLYLGEDRILWGTDSVFTGSAQEQIVALRAFQIPEAMQAEFGYPALTECARRKILGLNAARVYEVDPAATIQAITNDTIAQWRMARLFEPRAVPINEQKYYGPRTRREFFAFLDWERSCVG